MLSRLKSSVKGVVQAFRGGAPQPSPVVARPAAVPSPASPRPPPTVVKTPVPAPTPAVAKPAPAPIVAKPAPAVEVAKAAPAPAAAPAKAATKPVNGVESAKKAAAEPKAEPAAAPEPAKPVVEAAPAKAPPPVVEAAPAKKPSLASLAAAAAKAPAPAPVAARAEEDEDAHDGGHVETKAPRLADVVKAAATGQAAGRMVRADMGSTDRAAYIARAIANNRDPNAIKGGEGLNTTDDGESYWGPLDNESSRAKAGGRVLTIDQFECISCGTCVEQTNRVFYLPLDGKATPIAQDGPMDLIQDAIEACPVTCIDWVAPAAAEEKGLATGVGQDWSEVIDSLPVD